MKLRRQPEDFRVDEVCELEYGSNGSFAVYELTKRDIGTLDAIDHVMREWKLPRFNAEHAGMKDRHAVTSQWITIRNGPAEDLELPLLSLTYLGQSLHAIQASDIAYNRFEIVLRSLDDADVETIRKNLPEVTSYGVPNYFDDQRFGSLPESKEFIAAAWIKQDYERALWLTFAEHLPDDSASERAEKEILRSHWGDWETCKAQLSRSHRRSVVTFLDDKKGETIKTHFKGAWACVNEQLRGIYLSAFQAHLWNMILDAFLRYQTQPEQLIPITLKPGTVHVTQALSESQFTGFAKSTIHLPSARLSLPPGFEADLIQGALKEQGWQLSDLKVRHPRDRFFSRAKRRVMLQASDFDYAFDQDDLDTQLQKCKLSFSLPRGSYATMIVKRLMISGEVTGEK